MSDAPAAIAFWVLRRISSATDTDSQPEARRSARAVGRSVGGFMPPGRGVAEGSKEEGPAMERSLNPEPATVARRLSVAYGR